MATHYVFDRQDRKTILKLNRFTDMKGTTIKTQRLHTRMRAMIADVHLIGTIEQSRPMPVFGVQMRNYLSEIHDLESGDDLALITSDGKRLNERLRQANDDLNPLNGFDSIYILNNNEVKMLVDAGAYDDETFNERLQSQLVGKSYDVDGDALMFEDHNQLDGEDVTIYSVKPDSKKIVFDIHDNSDFTKLFYETTQILKKNIPDIKKDLEPKETIEDEKHSVVLHDTINFDKALSEKSPVVTERKDIPGVTIRDEIRFNEFEKNKESNKERFLHEVNRDYDRVGLSGQDSLDKVRSEERSDDENSYADVVNQSIKQAHKNKEKDDGMDL